MGLQKQLITARGLYILRGLNLSSLRGITTEPTHILCGSDTARLSLEVLAGCNRQNAGSTLLSDLHRDRIYRHNAISVLKRVAVANLVFRQ